ncbi:MAG: hypothetical protein H0X30_31185 [Anaerolineae bacterium]|nr:hypothetical protein [Anaerolineae bacterium]
MKRIIAIGLFGLLMVGCTPKATEALPTLIPTPQPVSPATETPVPTVAPTEDLSSRATLPPSWTPSEAPTDIPIPATETPLPQITAIPTLVACGPFDVDRTKSAATFTVGQPAQVYWTPVQGAVRYRIGVLNAFNQEIFMDYAVDATYTFKPDLFEAGTRYAWRVYPEDSLGRQMCLAVTGDMSPG